MFFLSVCVNELYSCSTDNKVAYLTFDDGPKEEYLMPILETLDKHEIKATFFQVGDNAKRREDLVQLVIDQGHVLGIHALTDPHTKNEKIVTEEFVVIQDYFKERFNYETRICRFPYGSWWTTQEIADQMKEHNLLCWDWTIDGMEYQIYEPDYETQEFKNKEQLVNDILSITDENIEVILLHENQGTIDVLEDVILGLKKKGYQFDVWSEESHFPLNFGLDMD